jgi:6,7-dimethyl-8-ribityllumazine synthase
MDKIKTTEGDLIVRDARFTIVASRFNDFIVESLLKASLRCLRQHGAADADIDVVRVPGAFEMPVAVSKIAASRRADGIIALGCVIRGGTPHFDYVAGECIEQAIERAGTKAGNKGEEATLAVIEMVDLLRRID